MNNNKKLLIKKRNKKGGKTLHLEKIPCRVYCSFSRSLERPTGEHLVHVCLESEDGAGINQCLCEVP